MTTYPKTSHRTVELKSQSPSRSPSSFEGKPPNPRQWNAKGFFPFRLEILTPVFVGSGEDFSPLDYVLLRSEGKDFKLHLIDTGAWLRAEAGNELVESALAEGDMLQLRSLMSELVDVSLFSLASLPLASEELGTSLLKDLQNPKSNSEVKIQAFVHNSITHTPILPGSSLKGALSTPIIDHFDRERQANGQQTLKEAYQSRAKESPRQAGKAYTGVMKDIFGDISEHAMQALKVSDITVPCGGSYIVRSLPKKLTLGFSDSSGEAHKAEPCEALVPSSAGGLTLYGRLHLDSGNDCGPGLTVKGKHFPFDEIKRWVNDFYVKRFNDEWELFYIQDHFKQTREKLQGIKDRLENLGDDCLLVRVGHYSHGECLTVTPPGNLRPPGVTRTLAEGVWPFGWVMLHFCPVEEYMDGIKAVENRLETDFKEHQAAQEQRETSYQQELERKRRDAEQLQKERDKAAEKIKQQQEQAAAHAAKLATMSPEERLLAELQCPDVLEEKLFEEYNKLDELDEDFKLKIAAALKDAWQNRGKWEGKISSKQEKKVLKVRSILGE